MILRNFFRKPIVKSYWWTKVQNFGDALAPLILARFADLERIEWAPIEEARVASIGSILEHIPPIWTGHIVGSGFLRETSHPKFDPHQVKILALRGPLSARGIPGSYGLGDPGILTNELIERQEKKWDLGIIPHWQDNELVPRFKSLIPKEFSIRIISPLDPPLIVVKQIAACRRVVTSSLHGMIVADSIGGIPRRVEMCRSVDGGDFKFRDYCMSINSMFEAGKMSEPNRNRVDDLKFQVWDAFRELSRVYGKG